MDKVWQHVADTVNAAARRGEISGTDERSWKAPSASAGAGSTSSASSANSKPAEVPVPALLASLQGNTTKQRWEAEERSMRQ